ncbi:MAG: EcoRV family type II restriction endonuclease [Anaerolineae bacterium]|nr:EcoRV family type II restriction endonuclease [Anaerolineae bacterium]
MDRPLAEKLKQEILENLRAFVKSLGTYVSTEDGQWTIKGFIDVYKNIYTISSDTKIVSKILEIHIFPKILDFAEQHKYALVLAEHQNYYPDISFVSVTDERIKFAVDFKTTYKLPDYPGFCNGFTLGSHGEYFINRESSKNIQFPYKDYLGHFCLGIIYSRAKIRDIDETKAYELSKLRSITSVIKDFEFFVAEKWRIASDKGGSGNTANIGSIVKIDDILQGNGMFSRLGEEWFDDYWMNYGKITITTGEGKTKKITSLSEFVKYRGGDANLIVPKASRRK